MSPILHHADCLDALRGMDAESIDAIVTDPPYGLSFMGKRWDYDVPSVDVWRECLRVLKPGGHVLAFGGSRTYHRLAVAVEDAGFEIRDQIMWVYGSGFPKSLDVSKAIDKAAGAVREVVGSKMGMPGYSLAPDKGRGVACVAHGDSEKECSITAPATEDAKQWQGWGTALKPAHEPIVMARKPLIGTVSENVLTHGTGAINVDGCRVGTGEDKGVWPITNRPGKTTVLDDGLKEHAATDTSRGRWPANFIHDGSDEVLELFPVSTSKSGGTTSRTGGGLFLGLGTAPRTGHDDTGSAARFFYTAKASKSERGEGNTHPTVKPLALMRYLCRLVTPPGGVVLDPFMGSGTTGRAAIDEGFRFVGIEREEAYHAIASSRISGTP